MSQRCRRVHSLVSPPFGGDATVNNPFAIPPNFSHRSRNHSPADKAMWNTFNAAF